MSPKKPNDFFDLSEFDDLLKGKGSSEDLQFDLFDLSLEDYDPAVETAKEAVSEPSAEEMPRQASSAGEDDLDLDSFLKLYDIPSVNEPAPVREEAPAEEEPAEEVPSREESLPVTLEEDAAEEDAAEEDAAEEESEADPEEAPEEEEEPRVRGGFFARFRRGSLEEEEEPEEDEEDGEDDDEEEEERPRFSLKGLFMRPVGSEEEEEDEEAFSEQEQERSRFSFAALFRRHEEEESEPADAEDASPGGAEDGSADGQSPDEGAGARISFFTKLSPEKEKFLHAMQSKKKKDEPSAGESTAMQKIPAAGMTASAAFRQLPREPKAGEMLVYDSELDEIDYIDEEDLPELRDYMPVRFSRHSRSGLGGGIMYALFVISISIVLACAGWLFASDVLALNKPDTTSIVTVQPYIPKDGDVFNEDGEPVDEEGRVITADVDQVASALKSAGVIDFKWLFKIFTELSSADVKIDPGTYDVSSKLDYRALVTEMQTGSDSQEITRITFPEGYTMDQIFQLLEDNGICDTEELYDAAANYDFSYEWLEEIPLGDARRLEGYLFPDTYDFYQGESAVNAINRFLNRFHYILTMDMYTQAENLGITIHEAVIIASLIEEEAGAEDNRAYFASVIYNRLDDGWKLQLDSTLNYIMGTSTLDLSIEDTEIDHPYNTYQNEGLPPGPISNPGKASLEAALNPADTNYWFWYAYEGKTTFFTNSSDFDNFAEAHPY